MKKLKPRLLTVAALALGLLPTGFTSNAAESIPSASSAAIQFLGNAAPPSEPLSLWYRRPATEWVEALPAGNGRLGVMAFGGIERERLQLNENTLWAGGPYQPDNPEALKALPTVRRLIFDGLYAEAAGMISSNIMARPLKQMPYQTVGDLWLTFPAAQAVQDYRRELNLDTAITRVSYISGGVTYTREVFVSPVDQVIVVRLAADQPGKISLTAGLTTPQKACAGVEPEGSLLLRGVNGDANGIKGALQFQARLRVLSTGGRTGAGSNSISVAAADSATLLVAIATSYKNFKDVSGDPETRTKHALATASKKSFDRLRGDHIAEHQRLFRRVSLDLGGAAAGREPTDERIAKFAEGHDPQLAALYYQYARYLLISSSRPGGQAANLQGLWNESMDPPWGSKFTININTEMNYWPAESGNLAECVEPLVAMVLDLTETGARTARSQWGARGWVTHHNTDLWRAAAPIDGPAWGMWPLGGAWLCQHLWDHYEFSGDRAFLKKIYPAMKGSAQFFLDTLVEEPRRHWLVTCPSLSPENLHPFGAAVCAGPTMDMQILRDLFANCIRAGEILDRDEDFRKQLAATRARLAPNQIGAGGQLQEWLDDWDQQAPEIHHRHVSHVYGLHPGSQINVHDTPALAAAARKSLEIRGDRATGWATAWRMNLWARLQEGDHAYDIFKFLLSPERTYPNMFDAHPPFQIDGNFGGAAGMVEMLLQSRAVPSEKSGSKFEIELLPALPKAWPAGQVKGLRTRGAFEVDLAWKDGRLVTAKVRSLAGNPVRLRYGSATHELKMKPNAEFSWDGR